MFFIFILFGFGIVYAILVWMLTLVLGILLFGVLTNHPLIKFLEGQGFLALTIDSTGVIEPFVIQIRPPFIKGKLHGKEINSLFDRETIFYMKPPRKGELTNSDIDDPEFTHYDLKVPKGKESQITFAFMQYPTIIYNKNLQEIMTKDALGKMETEGVIKHLVLYLKVKTEELTSAIKDFARYVVEMTKPKQSFLAGKGGIILIIFIVMVVVIMLILFAPSIMNIIGPMLNTASGSVKGMSGTIKGVGS
jgi:uncharacterized membrane protein